jgi:hypothetical protein
MLIVFHLSLKVWDVEITLIGGVGSCRVETLEENFKSWWNNKSLEEFEAFP